MLALSRSDLPVLIGENGPIGFPPNGPLSTGRTPRYWNEFEGQANKPTGLEDLATFLMVKLVGRRQVKKFFEEANASVPKFRKKLFVNCINYTNRLLTQNLPPLPARQLAVERAEDLLNFRIFRALTGRISTSTDPNFDPPEPGGTLLELLQSSDVRFGIGPNPSSMAINVPRAASRVLSLIRDERELAREPHFFFASVNDANLETDSIIAANYPNGNVGRGSADASPVIYSRKGLQVRDVDFVRNLIPDEVYQAAQFVLQVAVGPQVRPQERGWIAFRVFPQGIPAIDRFFDQILALLRAIQAAIESIAETIRRYIEFLQSRIRELQAFLNRLNALIQRLLRFFFSITPAAGLIVVAPGTEGVTTALIGSQNKPIPPANAQADAYGGGIVLFAGGIPNLAIDVFAALFKGND